MGFRRALALLGLMVVLMALVIGVPLTASKAQIIPMAFWQSGSSTGVVGSALRFRAANSACLTRTMTGSSTTWTMSMWVKSASTSPVSDLFTSVQTTGQGQQGGLGFTNPGGPYLGFYSYHPTPGYQTRKITSAAFRDPTAWYHLVTVWDTNNAVAEDRMRLYVNGVRVTSFSTNTVPGTAGMGHQVINNGFGMGIGCQNRNNGTLVYPFDGYIADVKYVDSQALDASAFGQFTNGVWVPKIYDGTYNANSFWLNFTEPGQTVSSNVGFGKDFWNSNYWVTNGISSTAGATYDGVSDAPVKDTGEGNYATLNPLQEQPKPNYSNGNLTAISTSINTSYRVMYGTIPVNSGKWYWEITPTYGGGDQWYGVTKQQTVAQVDGGQETGSYVFVPYNGNIRNNATTTAYGSAVASGGTIGVALDMDNGKIWFRNSTGYFSSGNPASGTGAAYSGLSGSFFPYGIQYEGHANTTEWNFGQHPFAYTPPAGFNTINTSNLQSSTIADPSRYFKTVTYTGTGTYQAVGEPVKQTSNVNLVNSLRFVQSSNKYLSRTPSSAGSRTTFTWSGWIKLGRLDAPSHRALFGVYGGNSDSTSLGLTLINDHRLAVIGWASVFRKTDTYFRDTSSWHHVVMAVDTNQATANNRIRLYVDGTEITSWNINNSPAQGASLGVNQASVEHDVGAFQPSATTGYYPFDGYMADVYFVDGQQLTPTSFGEYDADGDWVPKNYTGATGTNGFHLDFSDNTNVGKDAAGSNNFTANNFVTTASNPFAFTPSGFKAGSNTLINTNANNYISWNWKEGVTPGLDIITYTGNGTSGRNIAHNLGSAPAFIVIKDASAAQNWLAYHKSLGPTTGIFPNLNQAAVTNVAYFNNTAPTSSQFTVDGASGHGQSNANGDRYIAYAFAEVPGFSKFGSYTGNGSADGPFVHTGFKPAYILIKRTDVANDWSIIDSTRDAFNPTAKDIYANLTNADGSSGIGDLLSNGFKIRVTGAFANASGGTYIYAAFAESPFKEQSAKANLDVLSGLRFNGTSTYLNRTPASHGSRTVWTYSAWVKRSGLGAYQDLINAYTGIGDFEEVRFDNSDRIEFFLYSGNASQGYITTTGVFRDPAAWYHVVVVRNGNARSIYVNNVLQPVTVTTAWTAGLNSFITAANLHEMGRRNTTGTPQTFLNGYISDAYLVDGQALTPSSFGETNSAGLWVPKAYAGAYGTNGFHLDFGDPSQLGKDVAGSNHWTANNFVTTASNPFQFKATGFQVGNNSLINTNTNNYVSWNWKKGVTPGFDIVTWTGTGANRTISHGLGVAPKLMIVKRRDTGGNHWTVYSSSLPASQQVTLSNTNAAEASIAWNNTAPTSSVFSLGTGADVNGSGASYIGYLFGEVPGFSKFGSYTGNGSLDGPFVYTGFKPAYILIKKTSGAHNWFVFDNMRNTYNIVDASLNFDAASAESAGSTAPRLDMVANGFKIRDDGNALNTSAGAYIYAAFAESPFKEQASKANLDVLSGLRFNSANSASLSRVSGNGNTNKFTVSFWAKRGGSSAQHAILGSALDANNFTYMRFSNGVYFNTRYRISGTDYETTWAPAFRDPAAWYHFVYIYDRANATAADRQILYINGVRQPLASALTTPSTNLNSWNATGRTMYIGYAPQNAVYYDGYMADFYQVDGEALPPSSFGETNSVGLWVPKAYSGAYGTNGFHLEFLNPANPGIDTSGNGNTWTANNLASTDTLSDSPTNNYAVLNGILNFQGSAGVLSSGNLGFMVTGTNNHCITATQPVNTGKWYFEVTGTSSASQMIGLGLGPNSTCSNNEYAPRSNGADAARLYSSGGGLYQMDLANYPGGYPAYGVGDVIGVAIDADAGTINWYKNGTLAATDTVPANTWLTPVVGESVRSSTNINVNFGQGGQSGLSWSAAAGGAFKYAPPAGFKAMSTTNMPASAIPQPSQYFKASTYTGTGATAQSVNVGFQPDLTWIKDRTSGTNGHVLEDSARITAASSYLQSNTTAGEIKLFDPGVADNITDTPTNNYATLNPLALSGVALSNGNLTFTQTTTGERSALAGIGVTSGKWYWEFVSGTVGANNYIFPGLSKGNLGVTQYPGVTTDSWCYSSFNGSKYTNNAGAAYGATWGVGDVIGIAFDADNGKLYFSKNGVWQNSGDPVAGTNAAFTGLTSGPYFPAIGESIGGGGSTSGIRSLNFGQQGFSYAPPAGFKALSTTNMPASAIPQPSQYFKAVTYTGNGGTQNVNVGFSPDLTWIKDRSSGTNGHVIEDSVRVAGTSPYLQSNTTAGEIKLFDASLQDNMTDVPTAYDSTHGNFPTLNPLSIPSSGGTLSLGNLKYSSTTVTGQAQSAAPLPRTGKYYFEVRMDALDVNYTVNAGYWAAGVRQGLGANTNSGIIVQQTYTGACGAGCAIRGLVSLTSSGSYTTPVSFTAAAGDVYGFAIDMDAGKVWIARNNTWLASGNPTTGANPVKTYTDLATTPLYAIVAARSDASAGSNAATFNFGQQGWVYGPPDATFKPVNSYYYENASFVPDLVITKNRSAAMDWAWYDTARGPMMDMGSNLTTAQTLQNTGLLTFQNGGFTVGSLAKLNTSGNNYISYMFKKGVTPGFDIVTSTGNGVAGRTVAHNLGATPSFVLVKKLSAGLDYHWTVYQEALGPTKYLFLSYAGAGGTSVVYWNNTAPTSSVFSVGTDGAVNENGISYVAYTWSEVPGFSKFGTYTGNGSADGPFVYTGFKPAFVLFKNTGAATGWMLYDSTRSPYNPIDRLLQPASNAAEGNGSEYFDFLSNGFKIRYGGSWSNVSGNTYVYAAFAENPFKGAPAR